MAFTELSPSERRIVLQCMKAIADGPEIEDWEFQTRLGIVRPLIRFFDSLLLSGTQRQLHSLTQRPSRF